MVSPAQGLLMMQGGTDRTGLASLLDSVGTPGTDIISQRRAEAAQKAGMQEILDMMAAQTPGGEEPGNEEDSSFSFSDIFSGVDDYTDSYLTEKGQQKKDQLIEGAGNIGSGISDLMENPYNLLPGNLSYNIADKLGLIQEPDPENEPLFTIDVPEIIDKTKEKLSDMYNSEAGQFTRDIFSLPLLYAKDRFIDTYFKSDNDPTTFKADGGRVGAFSGGIMNNLLGSPQVQSMIQQYQQPTFDFSQVASPSIPQPAVAPATPPQAYTPFVSTMPLYDPSTLGTGLPSTAGMADPYFVYDQYSPVGAFDAPPSTGPTPLTQKQIDETFKNLDKFTLAKQKEKADAAAKAKTETRRNRGGEGNTPEARARRDALTERARDHRNRSRGYSGRGTSDPGGQAAREV
jgi:hypothetical protein